MTSHYHAANAVYVIQGEINCILTEMKRSVRYSNQAMLTDENMLVSNFIKLREKLYTITYLSELDQSTLLTPFLELVRSEETSGWITGLALTSLNKFLSYGYVECNDEAGCMAVENIADAVTHARFVGTDPESDEVVLMKILQVLRTLMLSPAGSHLTNESVCEIMQSCFRICFETRLSKLLRRSADQILVEMVQLLFSRLPEFTEDYKWSRNSRKLKMRAGGVSQKTQRKKTSSRTVPVAADVLADNQDAYTESYVSRGFLPSPSEENSVISILQDATVSLTNSATDGEILSTQSTVGQSSNVVNDSLATHMVDIHEGLPAVVDEDLCEIEGNADTVSIGSTSEGEGPGEQSDFVNPKGVRFVPKKDGPILPLGLPALRELFRFLISIINPGDKQNTDEMSLMGIYLLTIALETAVDHIAKFSSLMSLVKNELCFYLFRQLHSDRLPLFAASMRAFFLLFESARSHLKFQLEMYLSKLMDIVVTDNVRVTYDIKEVALQGLTQLWRIPGLITELYLNYDCDVHCSNLFEDIVKLLSKVTSTDIYSFSKNAFPVSGLYTTHLLSVDALLTVLDSVEANCQAKIIASKNEKDKKALNISNLARKPVIKVNRLSDVGSDMPSLEHLHAKKQQKQVFNQAVEMFNQKPKQGISYLQEQGYLAKTNEAIVQFLKETPKLNKSLIGEYISRKDNPELTEAYMTSFDFAGKRLDEALRMVLESFRLPGESPVIEYLMEHFSSHWFESNNHPFADESAAFTLVYAIIMLNVDQHNQNAKKQNEPMTLHQFRRNLKGVNGGQDFDQGMLEEIFNAIRGEEIVLPEERTGLVKETYMWKVLLEKSDSSKSVFLHSPTGYYDNELFSIIWGPTIAALSFVFDKSQDQSIIQKAITGFRKCAMISSHFGLSEVFDNLVISLCKFTTFLNSIESPDQIPISFSTNLKAQLSAKTVFNMARCHGDMLRDGWKNMLDCLLTLYRAKLLPHTFTEVEDFLHPEGKVKLIKERKIADIRNDSGVFNAFLTYFSDSSSQKSQTSEELQAREASKGLIEECELDSLIDDTKFLRTSSLQELIKALISLCQLPEIEAESNHDEDTVVFFLELLIRVVLQNRDRAGSIWQNVRDHLTSLILSSSDHTFLAERAVTGLLRLSIRLLCREEVASQVLPSLRILLKMKPTVLRSMSRQLAYGLHLLLETNAANIHSTDDWLCLFTLLEVIGAGGNIPSCYTDNESEAVSDGEAASGSSVTVTDRGYTSDSELYDHSTQTLPSVVSSSSSGTDLTVGTAPDNSTWLLVDKTSKKASLEHLPKIVKKKPIHNQFSICLGEELQPHDSKALMRCSEILVLLVRDAAHITPYNFDSCVHAIRVFVEASMKSISSDTVGKKKLSPNKNREKRLRHKKDHPVSSKLSKGKAGHNRSGHNKEELTDEEEEDGNVNEYKALSLQLLELMHTLHTRAASIFKSWAQENPEDSVNDDVCNAETSTLWRRCWCPLLQGLARLCTDARMEVRWHALRDLQRALLVQDLNQLTAVEWEACFNKVLFPLLSILLEKSAVTDLTGIEETRFRASTLLSKVYLQHLPALLTLPTSTALWLTILDFMDKYMHADHSGQLTEGIPELLKNMLLVMNGMQLFYEKDNPKSETQLCKLTCDRLNSFLPALKREIFSLPEQTEVPPCAEEITVGDKRESVSAEEQTQSLIDHRPASPPPLASMVPPVVTPLVAASVVPPIGDKFGINSPLKRASSPESAHRSSSPLVHSMPASAFTIQLHPPLAPPLPLTPPTLLPVTHVYTAAAGYQTGGNVISPSGVSPSNNQGTAQ